MTTIDKIVFSQNAPAKNTLWARPSEKGTELLIFNKGKWGTVKADALTHYEETSERTLYTGNIAPLYIENNNIFFDIPLDSLMQSGDEIEMKITPRGAVGSTVLRGTAGNDGKAFLRTSYYPSGPSAFLYNEYQHAFGTFNLVIYGIIVPQDTDFEIEIKVVSIVHVLNEKFIPATIARTEELRSGVFYNSNISCLTNVDGVGIDTITLAGINFTMGSGVLTMNGGTVTGVRELNINYGGSLSMNSGRINFTGGGQITPHYITGGGGYYAGINISNLRGVTFADGATISGTVSGIVNTSNLTLSGGTLNSPSINSGTITNASISGVNFGSGNTFTTGFVDELKTALGIS